MRTGSRPNLEEQKVMMTMLASLKTQLLGIVNFQMLVVPRMSNLLLLEVVIKLWLLLKLELMMVLLKEMKMKMKNDTTQKCKVTFTPTLKNN